MSSDISTKFQLLTLSHAFLEIGGRPLSTNTSSLEALVGLAVVELNKTEAARNVILSACVDAFSSNFKERTSDVGGSIPDPRLGISSEGEKTYKPATLWSMVASSGHLMTWQCIPQRARGRIGNTSVMTSRVEVELLADGRPSSMANETPTRGGPRGN